MLSDLDRPAELVRIAARSASAGNSAIKIEVVHLGPVPHETASPAAQRIQADDAAAGDALAAPLLPAGADHARGPATGGSSTLGPHRDDGLVLPHEEFLFSTLGCSTEVTTWPVIRSNAEEATVFDTGRMRGRRPGRRYVGTAVPNPGFLYEYAESVDVMLTYGNRGWRPNMRDSLFLTVALRTLAHSAAHVAAAPILFMQTPVAPATESAGDGSRESGRPANGHAIRLSVGIGRGQARSRILFLDAVDAFAAEWGLTMHVGDRRVRRIRGEWSQVRTGDENAFRRARDSRFGFALTEAPARVVLVTAVGPARVGSSHTIAALLEREGIGVLSAAVTSLSEMAVIDLVLAVSPRADEVARTSGGSVRSIEKGLSQLRGICSLDSSTTASEDVDTRPAAGYTLLRSETYLLADLPKVFDQHVGPYPVWAAWDLPDGTLGQRQVIELLVCFLASETMAVEVSYARTRRVDNGRRRGRAKVAVTLQPASRREGTPAYVRDLSERAEEYVRVSLAANGLDPEDCRLRVTSRERWLGRWHLPV
jgi:hypothetical protein